LIVLQVKKSDGLLTSEKCVRIKNLKKKIDNSAENRPNLWKFRKKNQLFISLGLAVINFLLKPCNSAFLQKKMTGQKP
jgi:hypothetical protein